MFRKISIFVFLFSTCTVSAINPKLYGENSKAYGEDPIKYLMSKSYVLYVVKLTNVPTRFEYNQYMSESGLSKSQIRNNWNVLSNTLVESYLVVKEIKGNRFIPGDILTIENISRNEDDFSERAGESFILYVDEYENALEFRDCDSVHLEPKSDKQLSYLLSLEVEAQTSEVVRKNALKCSMEEEIRYPVEKE